ncbi:hypothetical protein CDAR_603271 [Caerostris darwini]|uniref:Uncharacterized protein n=1 Tax=Caerostris darwini TaxID=1538125 RepID=A0AAV4PLR7_9ARAC|nr:hypothetical protein CDAR_603271 [Caerostris darwini]
MEPKALNVHSFRRQNRNPRQHSIKVTSTRRDRKKDCKKNVSRRTKESEADDIRDKDGSSSLLVLIFARHPHQGRRFSLDIRLKHPKNVWNFAAPAKMAVIEKRIRLKTLMDVFLETRSAMRESKLPFLFWNWKFIRVKIVNKPHIETLCFVQASTCIV